MYRVVKLPFKSIFKNDDEFQEFNNKNITKINTAMIKVNKITIKTYQLLRLWVLDKYHSNVKIPKITEDTISMAMKSLNTSPIGTTGEKNRILYNEFIELNTNHLQFEREDASNLSYTLASNITQMLTSIENNIKLHFFDYINRFINSYFCHIYQEQITNKEFKKNLYKELTKVKKDLKDNTLTCDQKYHSFLNTHRFNILPELFKKTYNYDIQTDPQQYLKNMIWMNLELEQINGKMFQFFPLQSSIVPNYIHFDTVALIELLYETSDPIVDKNIILTKKLLKAKSSEYKTKVWEKFFNINVKSQEQDNYFFDYSLSTNCHTVSLRFLTSEQLILNNKTKAAIKKGAQAPIEEKIKKRLVNDKKRLKKEKKNPKFRNEIERIDRELLDVNIELEKLDITVESEDEEEIPYVRKVKEDEFSYIDDVNKEELIGKHIFIDPGKKTLFSMIDDEGNRYNYSNGQRLHETKRLKYNKLLKNHRKKEGIVEIETILSSFNSKSCIFNNFKAYIQKKNEINELLFDKYLNEKFRKYKWFSYLNTVKSNKKMVDDIEKKYSKDHIIIIGDWSVKKQMKHMISTPNLTLKRLLAKKFKVYNIDEFRTSCLDWHYEGYCGNLNYIDKKGKTRELHSVLTYKMENNRLGCINRDNNGCRNIMKVFNHYIECGERPLRFRRGVSIK